MRPNKSNSKGYNNENYVKFENTYVAESFILTNNIATYIS